MPPRYFRALLRLSAERFECFGQDNLICFTSWNQGKGLLYDVDKKVWSWIAGCALQSYNSQAQSVKPISSPVPDAWYPTLAVFMLAIGLIVTASFFIYEATSSRKNRSLAKELTTGAVASVFLGFGSLFLLLSSGVYV
ncbi:UNVERIFIED_CONTAM: F-box/kelch-repeat protein [Sesamum calycinum]|uniref:Dolichyl-diphosphooligosaccharide-protein glycosyltransferase subunit OST5 n=1 Tax=Sesamum calycinum TaxID=2727403 RepID=A0AAW2N2L4_9LAMI